MILTATMGGCSSLLTSNQPPEQIYWLEPHDMSREFTASNPGLRLRVTVAVIPGLDTDRLLVKGPGPTLNHYAAARWPDNLPEMIDSLLRRSLQSTGLFSRVGESSAAGPFDARMRLEVHEFFAVVERTEATPVIHVAMTGEVDCGSDPAPLNARATSASADNRLTDIAVAYQSGLNAVIGDLTRQIQQRCAHELKE